MSLLSSTVRESVAEAVTAAVAVGLMTIVLRVTEAGMIGDWTVGLIDCCWPTTPDADVVASPNAVVGVGAMISVVVSNGSSDDDDDVTSSNKAFAEHEKKKYMKCYK